MKITPGDSADRGNILSQIFAAKASVLAQECAREPYGDVEGRALQRRSERRSFLASLVNSDGVAVIAEIKRASPSAGVIADDFDVVAIALSYAAAGANAVSVLSETEYFLGDLAYLDVVRRATRLPVLRKDFLWTRYQIAQSAAYGADCVLLILAGLSDEALRDCLEEAARYDLDALIEVHDESELERAVTAGAKLIGINNRDLRTLEVDLCVAERLLPKVPTGIVAVSESGIRSADDAARLRAAGARGFLIGEAMMRTGDPAAFLAELRNACGFLRHAR
jgi:indole-3-glycerol phosphate synthase